MRGSPAKWITASKFSNDLWVNVLRSGSQKIEPGQLELGSPRRRRTTSCPCSCRKEKTSEPINPEEPDKRMRKLFTIRIFFCHKNNEGSLARNCNLLGNL